MFLLSLPKVAKIILKPVVKCCLVVCTIASIYKKNKLPNYLHLLFFLTYKCRQT